MGGTLALSELLCGELLLFAALGLIIGGLDDLAIDLIYLARRGWRSLTVYSRVARMTSRDLPPAGSAGPIAVFIPAWDESDVIRPMLTGCLDKWAGEDVQIFVGAYPNDPATLWAVCTLITERGGGRVTLVVNDRPGPTTKADCLNQLWVAMQRWEAEQERRVLTVVLHDAEQVVPVVTLRKSQKSANVRFQGTRLAGALA